MGVGGATPSGSGAGITFPATASNSTDANTLDDYEEGTWTPTLTSQNGSLTSVTAGTGYYTKVGRQVNIICFPTITNVGTGSGVLILSGLPFTSLSSIYASGSREDAATGIGLVTSAWSSTEILLAKYDNGTVIGTNYRYPLSITYIV
jgi:hypothetical protein